MFSAQRAKINPLSLHPKQVQTGFRKLSLPTLNQCTIFSKNLQVLNHHYCNNDNTF